MNLLNRVECVPVPLKLAVIFGLSLSSVQVAAKPYSAAVTIGQSNTDVTQNHPDIESIDDSDTSWSVELGYDFDVIGIRLGYLDLGEASVQITGESYTPQNYHQLVSQVAPVLVEGVTLGIELPIINKDGWQVSAQLGEIFWQNEIQSTRASGQTIKTDTQGREGYFGATLNYSIDKHWKIGSQFRQYMFEQSINDLSFKLIYQF